MNQISFSDRLHEAAAPIWEECIHHPFITGIGDGTLDIEKFKYYMLQDYLYLFEYAKVFALGVVKSRDHQMMQTFAQNMNIILNGEMNIHRNYLQRLGITEEQVLAAQPAPDNISYTSYMLSIAETGSPIEIVTAILACSWSYAEIGHALAEIPGTLEHPFYGEWLRSYSGKEYAATNAALISLMNALTMNASEAQLQYLTKIFVNCSRYELRFWDMSWEMRA